MKYASEDLMKAMGLSVGDRVKIDGYDDIFTVVKNGADAFTLEGEAYIRIKDLIDKEIEILPAPKRVGDLKCSNVIECAQCPIKLLCNGDMLDLVFTDNLYNILENFKLDDNFDQEIYDILKARLDKEVTKNED